MSAVKVAGIPVKTCLANFLLIGSIINDVVQGIYCGISGKGSEYAKKDRLGGREVSQPEEGTKYRRAYIKQSFD